MPTKITFMTTSGHEFLVHALNFTADTALNGVLARMDSQRAFTAETPDGLVIVNTCGIAMASAEDTPQTELD
jgi:hypothetical protein